MVNFEETYHFSRFQRGSNFFQWGPTFSRGGGSNCLFPIETHITCDFPVGSGPPVPPLDPHLWSYQRPVARKSKPPPFPGSVGRSYEDDVECNQILPFPLIYPPHYTCF